MRYYNYFDLFLSKKHFLQLLYFFKAIETRINENIAIYLLFMSMKNESDFVKQIEENFRKLLLASVQVEGSLIVFHLFCD